MIKPNQKSFKDYIPSESTKQDAPKPKTPKKQTSAKEHTEVQKVQESLITAPVVEANYSFQDQVDRTEIRNKIYEEEKTALEQRLVESINQQVSKEYEEKFTTLKNEYNQQLLEAVNKISEHNSIMMGEAFLKLVDATNALCEKVDVLCTNLNITVPTPIVHFSMPERTVVKKVHRDANGNITHISEEIDPTQ